MDWIPSAGAGDILAIRAECFRVSWGLRDRTDWAVITCGTPPLLAGLIFPAAGLVLPGGGEEYPDDLGTYIVALRCAQPVWDLRAQVRCGPADSTRARGFASPRWNTQGKCP